MARGVPFAELNHSIQKPKMVNKACTLSNQTTMMIELQDA